MNTSFASCDLCDAHKGDTSGSFRVLPPVFRVLVRQAGPACATVNEPAVETVKFFPTGSILPFADTEQQGGPSEERCAGVVGHERRDRPLRWTR